ncbi:LOW QUALITY PROTEIN: neurogenic locus Notch protein-like [Diaphorina citri]|uniref:LOW QUALITY PROTEIN: neurogenic locus Notch protein-like n=1 Tax=Diaphorina citri TaxID=121845 RepID=A0A3Q0JA20_DIACI|nr:LOW QUALITY PROTEIN: neurogenic locus Notch protein-like [Diaphorina citri]
MPHVGPINMRLCVRVPKTIPGIPSWGVPDCCIVAVIVNVPLGLIVAMDCAQDVVQIKTVLTIKYVPGVSAGKSKPRVVVCMWIGKYGTKYVYQDVVQIKTVLTIKYVPGASAGLASAACVDGRCRNPCEADEVCGRNAECAVVNHTPRCTCVAGTVGDPKSGCVKLECTHSTDCGPSQVCVSSKCVDPCDLPNSCGQNAACRADKHAAVCTCAEDHTGDPFLGCTRLLYCSGDSQCPTGTHCSNGLCSASCTSSRDCIGEQQCISGLCQPTCRSNTTCPAQHYCNSGLCVLEMQCTTHDQCSATEQCRSNDMGQMQCRPACEGILCGRNALCTASDHHATCSCKPGYVGHPGPSMGTGPSSHSGHAGGKHGPGLSPGATSHSSHSGGPVGCHRVECNSHADCSGDKVCEDHRCKISCLANNPCGPNALCSAEKHKQICYCQPGYTGDAYFGCHLIDFCAAKPCGPGARCDNSRGSYKCLCPLGLVGDPYGAGCVSASQCTRDDQCPPGAHCVKTDGVPKCKASCQSDEECGLGEKCLQGQCNNPCERQGACGVNSLCNVLTHRKVCFCPRGFTGDPETECVRMPVPCEVSKDCPSSTQHVCKDNLCIPQCSGDNDCALNEKCSNGTCVLTCLSHADCYPGGGSLCLANLCTRGCSADTDCPAALSCRSAECVDPCSPAPCGPNAQCSVANHRPLCSCPAGLMGLPSANTACVRTPALECEENRQCKGEGEVCADGRCRPLCSSDGGCLSNERCDTAAGVCKPLCHRDDDCSSGEVCRGLLCSPGCRSVCKPLCHRDDDCSSGEVCRGLLCSPGCRSDTGCADNQACVDNSCQDPCLSPTACGTNAQCSVQHHEKQCLCPKPLQGDPNIACRPETRMCAIKRDCPSGSTCTDGVCLASCKSDSNCLTDERCIKASCQTICNSDSKCDSGQICEDRLCVPGCRTDSVCADNQACVNKQCTDPCTLNTTCGPCSACRTLNHGPQCTCPLGYSGHPLLACTPSPMRCDGACPCDETSGYCASMCGRDEECQCGEKCDQGRCRVKCTGGVHSACPMGQICSAGGVCQAGCRVHSDCPQDKSCIDGQCRDPCAKGSPGDNLRPTCGVANGFCTCPLGYSGHPLLACTPSPMRCDGACPCDETSGYCASMCGRDEECQCGEKCDQGRCRVKCTGGVHSACPMGQICSAGGVCQAGCRVHSDCPQDKSCIDGQCRDPCAKGSPGDNLRPTCGVNALCRVVEHRPVCLCPDNYQGDPTDRCESYRCKQDSDCEPGKSCRGDGVCRNPCLTSGVCGVNAQCRVLQRHAVCSCPPGYLGNPRVQCKQPVAESCSTRNPCGDQALCTDLGGGGVSCTCPPGCTGDPHQACVCTGLPPGCQCGQNANCTVQGGRQECVCPIEYPLGDPYVQYVECTSDDDCSYDKSCSGGKCTNMCSKSYQCSKHATCIVVQHKPMCLCKPCYLGNGTICTPDTQCKTCQSNKHCKNGQVCMNNRCEVSCTTDDACKVGHKCVQGICKSSSNLCKTNIECSRQQTCIEGVCENLFCSSDTECSLDQICKNNMCLDTVCNGDLNCRDGQVCNEHGICKTKPPRGPDDRQDTECKADQDCAQNQVCTDGKCNNAMCTLDSDCSQVEICKDSKCVPMICNSNFQCKSGQFCDEDGFCQVKACTADIHCKKNETCEDFKCVNKMTPNITGTNGTNVPCKDTKDCRYGEICKNNICKSNINCKNGTCSRRDTCKYDYECENNGVCNQGLCDYICTQDYDCNPGETCRNGLCKLNTCNKTADCSNRQVCKNNLCKNTCRKQTDCKKDVETCVNNVCKVTRCKLDKDCDANEVCKNATCTSQTKEEIPVKPEGGCKTDADLWSATMSDGSFEQGIRLD